MDVRSPAVAGMFYPGSEAALKEKLDSLIPKESKKKKVIAIVSPHAGYIYSGAVAGEVISLVEVPSRVILLGPNHTGLGSTASIMTEGRWELPNGFVDIDNELAQGLLSRSSLLSSDNMAHVKEHSLEVHIPFLIHERPDVKIVPVTLMGLDLESCMKIGLAVAAAVQSINEDVLIISSSDMTHYESRESAKEKDFMAIDRIIDGDPEGLYNIVHRKKISMCGVIPTTVMLCAAKELGATKASLVRYSTSGDVSGEYGEVVGYAGLIIE